MAIENWGNRVAKQLFENETTKGLPLEHHARARFLLEMMIVVDNVNQLVAVGTPPALRPHKLKGDRKGTMAIDIDKVSGWRITFKFIDGKFADVAIENYH